MLQLDFHMHNAKVFSPCMFPFVDLASARWVNWILVGQRIGEIVYIVIRHWQLVGKFSHIMRVVFGDNYSDEYSRDSCYGVP